MMPGANDAVDASIQEVERLRKYLGKSTTQQVRATEERTVIKATCLAWFNNHRPAVREHVDSDLLDTTDEVYKALLGQSDRATSRSKYDGQLKRLKKELSGLRSLAIDAQLASEERSPDTPPSFAALVPDPKMQAVLERRWHECATCVTAGASLAATVMMGGLLEALLLARVHRESDKSRVFGATTAPKDRKSGKPLLLQEWTLRNYLDVAHELGWITRSAKDVGEVVRDYRNYVHPHKELSHGVELARNDPELFWEISKTMVRQLLT